jgi:hypothetical protein
MDIMLTSAPQILSTSAPRSGTNHEFAYPRVRQIAPRAHTVLVSSLNARRPSVPAASRQPAARGWAVVSPARSRVRP